MMMMIINCFSNKRYTRRLHRLQVWCVSCHGWFIWNLYLSCHYCELSIAVQLIVWKNLSWSDWLCIENDVHVMWMSICITSLWMQWVPFCTYHHVHSRSRYSMKYYTVMQVLLWNRQQLSWNFTFLTPSSYQNICLLLRLLCNFSNIACRHWMLNVTRSIICQLRQATIAIACPLALKSWNINWEVLLI